VSTRMSRPPRRAAGACSPVPQWPSPPPLAVGPRSRRRPHRRRPRSRPHPAPNRRGGYFDYTTPPFPGAAITFNTVLSISYALDQVVPELEALDASR
jgi:hypothetical protein